MILIALAVLAANPATFTSVLAAAKPGDTIRLVEGNYPKVAIFQRTFNPPLNVDATAATLAGIQFGNMTGVNWTGGSLVGNPQTTIAANYGVLASQSREVSVSGVHITGFRVGIVYDRVTGGAITGNWLSHMSTDGIDVAASRGLTVTQNACSDFSPSPGAHPDCIQLWSRADYPPTADMTVTGNSVVGTMQGISLFDHVINGVDEGGFDRIKVDDNTVLNTFGAGITLLSCRGCTARNNKVGSLPNYINRAQLYVWGGSVEQCGNVVTMVPRQGTPPCRDGG